VLLAGLGLCGGALSWSMRSQLVAMIMFSAGHRSCGASSGILCSWFALDICITSS